MGRIAENHIEERIETKMRLKPVSWDEYVDIGEEDDIAFGLGKCELLSINLREIVAIVS